jgi:hypothetical protein
MTEDELRTLVRAAVARHVGSPDLTQRRGGAGTVAGFAAPVSRTATDASHYQYLALVNVGESCLIEPSVECNHCGYCRSHGH